MPSSTFPSSSGRGEGSRRRETRRTLRSVVAVGALLASLPALADLEQALRSFKVGKYEEASALFQALVDESPDYAYGYYMLGNCFLKMREPDQAESSFRMALSKNRARFEYHYGLAHSLMAQGLYGESIQVLSAVEPLVLDRHRFAFHSMRGFDYAALKRWDAAVRDLEAAASIRKDKTVLDALGKAEIALRRFDRAAIVLRLSAAENPSDVETQRMLSESLLRVAATAPDSRTKRSYYMEALRAAEHVFSSASGVESLDLLARAALGAGDYSRAIVAFRAVLDASPERCVARLNLSTAEIAEKLWRDAEKTLQEAKRCPQGASVAYLRLGHVYFRQGRFQEALASYRKSDALEPSIGARIGIGAALKMLERAETSPTVPARR